MEAAFGLGAPPAAVRDVGTLYAHHPHPVWTPCKGKQPGGAETSQARATSTGLRPHLLPPPPPYENPNKTRRTRRDKNSAPRQPVAKERELESPEKRVAHRRSSLPNAVTAPTQDDDPFLANYRGPSAVRPTSRAPSRNRGPFGYPNIDDLTPSRITTAEPLDLYADYEEEEGEIVDHHPGQIPDETPRSSARHPHRNPPNPHHPSNVPPPADDPMDGADADGATDGFPTDSTFKALAPTNQEKNPHVLYPAYTPSGPDDLVAATTNFQINTGEWRALVMAFQTATENTAAAQVDAALADPPAMSSSSPSELVRAVEPITGPNGLFVVPPTAAKKPLNERDKYTAPLAMIGRAATPAIRDALLRHSVIPISKSLAVHILPIDTDARTWTMGLFKCNWPGGGEETAASFRLAAFKEARKKGPLRDLIVQATQPGAITSPDARVQEFARTFIAVYLDHPKDPVWVMYGRPCTKNFELWEAIRCHARNMSMEDGLTLFLPLGRIPRGEESRPPPIAISANSTITSRMSARMLKLSTGVGPPKSSQARPPVYLPTDRKGKAAITKAGAGGVFGVDAAAGAAAAKIASPLWTPRYPLHVPQSKYTTTVQCTVVALDLGPEEVVWTGNGEDDRVAVGEVEQEAANPPWEPALQDSRLQGSPQNTHSTANETSDTRGSGGSATGHRPTGESVRMAGESAARRSEGCRDCNDPERESTSATPDGERRAANPAQGSIDPNAMMLYASDGLVYRDPVHRDESNTVRVSHQPVIGLDPVQGNGAPSSETLQMPRDSLREHVENPIGDGTTGRAGMDENDREHTGDQSPPPLPQRSKRPVATPTTPVTKPAPTPS
ncbi:hypothetical protein B0H10DRAFT_2220405 [Mycena sp. CBHHK59/15]|nr:hypothetical protein B0H10DRAFT_2220405 [Mycena sp. CBHHK59/15]